MIRLAEYVGLAWAYMLVAAAGGRLFYSHYPWARVWNYGDRVPTDELVVEPLFRALGSFLVGLLWPVLWIVPVILWRNITAPEREIEVRKREERVAAMEKELGL